MNIEKLTKMQIVMLTLLVSFVTSIATGIVTVTLMDQAPPVITQTLNRVVERTVERVVPGESQTATVIEKETTVVVKEEDLIIASIDKNLKSIVRIYEVLEEGVKGKLSGLGVIIFRDGLIATDSSVVNNDMSYIVETAQGKTYSVNITGEKESDTLKFLMINVPKETEEEMVFPTAKLSNGNMFKLGQTVLSLTGEEKTEVAIGIISGLVDEDVEVKKEETEKTSESESGGNKTEEVETIKVLSFIKTSIDKKEVVVGSPLVDIFGEVIGISAKDSLISKTASFTPVNRVKASISSILESKTTSENQTTKEQ